MGILDSMQSVWGNLQGTWNAFQAFRRIYEEPAYDYIQQNYYQREMEYMLLWSYYNGSVFEETTRLLNAWSTTGWSTRSWRAYISHYRLPKTIRPIYNPTRRLVDFYPGAVYPGVLSEDGEDLPDGMQSAIPFSEDTSPQLKTAIAQLWQWNNWQQRKDVEVTYGGALGDVMVEIVDDIDRGKVCFEIPWPGYVCDMDLDHAGNVKSYTLEYGAYDEDEGGFYRFKKIVDDQYFQYFKDDEPYAYDYGSAVLENPYGFTPAVWIKFNDTGGDRGSPAIAGSMSKIDELNGLASLIHDQVRKVVRAPIILWSQGNMGGNFGNKPAPDTEMPTSDQEELKIMKGPMNGKVESLAGDLIDLAQAAVHMDRLVVEIENDHPELTLYKELRAMSQVTGPAAARLVGDVEVRVMKAQAIFDRGNIALFQMATAIAGFRANERAGGWARQDRQQQKFLPFNLDSYQAGNLDMSIMPRPLLTPTKLERAMENQAIWTGVQAAAKAGVPLEFVLESEGWTEQELQKLTEAKQKEDAAAQQKFEQQQKAIAQNANNQQNDNNQQQDMQNGNKQAIGQKG